MSNFEFLKYEYSELLEIGSLAEENYGSDPASCIAKLRIFVEYIAKELYYSNFNSRAELKLSDMLQDLRFFLPPKILDVFQIIRKKGNQASHQNIGSKTDALKLLQYCHGLGAWFYLLNGGNKEELTPFKEPLSRLILLEKELEEAKKHQEQLAKQMENKILDLQKQLKSKEQIEEKLKKLEINSKQADTDTARIINFTEAETRHYLIDKKLLDSGWNIKQITDSKIDIKEFDTREVKREVPVTGLPNTPTGNGFVDYVLYDDNNNPIAIIEAKKTYKDVKEGKEQARQYANALEKMTGFRPLIFYTNGFNIFLWDDVLYPERKIYGFFSKDDVESRLFQRSNRKLLENVEINIDTISRDYQFMALRNTYESFSAGQRKALLVMATGTGKTRTAMAIIDGLVESNWVKRVLFLVDRDELRKQANNAFKKHLDSLSRVLLNCETRGEQNKKVYIATYPAMMQYKPLYSRIL